MRAPTARPTKAPTSSFEVLRKAAVKKAASSGQALPQVTPQASRSPDVQPRVAPRVQPQAHLTDASLWLRCGAALVDAWISHGAALATLWRGSGAAGPQPSARLLLGRLALTRRLPEWPKKRSDRYAQRFGQALQGRDREADAAGLVVGDGLLGNAQLVAQLRLRHSLCGSEFRDAGPERLVVPLVVRFHPLRPTSLVQP